MRPELLPSILAKPAFSSDGAHTFRRRCTYTCGVPRSPYMTRRTRRGHTEWGIYPYQNVSSSIFFFRPHRPPAVPMSFVATSVQPSLSLANGYVEFGVHTKVFSFSSQPTLSRGRSREKKYRFARKSSCKPGFEPMPWSLGRLRGYQLVDQNANGLTATLECFLQGKYAEAQPLFARAVAINEVALGVLCRCWNAQQPGVFVSQYLFLRVVLV